QEDGRNVSSGLVSRRRKRPARLVSAARITGPCGEVPLMSLPCRVVVLALLVCCIHAAPLYAEDLWQAIAEGDAAKVKKLLDADPKLARQVNKSGAAPLHWAARGDNVDIVRLLLDAKADVNAKGEDD